MTKLRSYGYSEPRLQPGYLICTTLMLLLAPLIGWFWASVVVLVPAGMVVRYALRHYTKTWREIVAEADAYTANAERIAQTPLRLPARPHKSTKTPATPLHQLSHSS